MPGAIIHKTRRATVHGSSGPLWLRVLVEIPAQATTRGNASTLRLMTVRMDSLVSNSVTERQCATTSREHGEPMRGPSRRPTTLAQATDRIPVVPQGNQSSTHAPHGKQAATV